MTQIFTHGYAVVIGVGADLPVTIADAQGVAELLCDATRCAYPPQQVQLLTGPAAKRDAVLTALTQLANQTQNDPDATAIVYFSGHGLETPAYHLMPFGYKLDDLPNTAISGVEFTNHLRKIQAKKLVVLLDCCHAGGQAEAKGRTGIKSPLPAEVASELGRSSGRIVIASSRKDEVSWTGKPYSVFTAALLEAFAGYGSFENDGYVRVLDLSMWLGRKVPERTQDKQHPILKVSALEDNFALAYYAAGDKTPKKLTWSSDGSTLPVAQPGAANNQEQIAALKRQLENRRRALRLMEERMTEYIEYQEIPLQLIDNKRRTEADIQELERKLSQG